MHESGLAPIDSSALSRPQDALLWEMPLRFQKTFYPLGYSVEISTNDLAVFEAAEESFGHAIPSGRPIHLQVRVGMLDREGAVCPPEPTRHQCNHLFSLVADVDNQALLDLEASVNFTWLTQATLKNRLYFRTNFLEKAVYLLLGASVVTDLHAACVGRNGKGILLCGQSGAGKSTLAYACARVGWTYTSDDTSYLINDAANPRVIGHSHRARFRPSARSIFPELEGRAVTPRMEGKPSIEVPIAELPVKHTSTEADIHAVVFLERHSGPAGHLARQPAGEAANRLRRELYSAGSIRARHEEILGVLCNIPAYDLQYCHLQNGVEALENLALQL